LVTDSALLYDPAVTRSVRVQMEKLVLLLCAALARMGARVLHASMTRVVLATSRRTLGDAATFTNSLCASLATNPLFAALHIRTVHTWNSLLWVDSVSRCSF
jgi:DNA polymerase epsilon subunit 1